MAKVLNYESQIQQGEIVQSWHVSQSVDAFTGVEDYAISISGSVNLTSSLSITPSLLLTTGQNYLLTYNDTTGQVYKALTSSINIPASTEGFHVYKTGSNITNIIPNKFGTFDNTGTNSAISSGNNNKINSNCSFIGGGQLNTASAACTFIGGGCNNTISTHTIAVIVGGRNNSIAGSGGDGFLGGGSDNAICSSTNSGHIIVGGTGNKSCNTSTGGGHTIVVGGCCNCALENYSVVIGGIQNSNQGSCSFIGGGTTNTINISGLGGYGIIVGGSSNCIDGSSKSYNFIGNGSSNCIIDTDGSVIGSGASNKITKGSCNAIITGFQNCVETSAGSGCSAILTGRTNKVTTTYSVIGSGCNNIITGSTQGYNFIGTGCKNTISGSNYSSIVGGVNNSSSASCSFIGAGSGSFISGSCDHASFIGAGKGNKIQGHLNLGSAYSAIVAGDRNLITGASASIDGNNFIGAGQLNKIEEFSHNSSIVGGFSNFICNTSTYGRGFDNSISGGKDNNIIGHIGCFAYNTITGGEFNKIIANSGSISGSFNGSNSILGGQFNCIKIEPNCSACWKGSNTIVGGGFNKICDSKITDVTKYNTIIGGSSNIISGSVQSNIIGGNGNNIRNSKASAILGGCNISIVPASKACNFVVAATCGKTIDPCNNTFYTCNAVILGCLEKATGTFKINHPNPELSETHDLYHSFVESPTAGDNIYRFSAITINNEAEIILPEYYRYLNKDSQLWVSADGHFGKAFGLVNISATKIKITSNEDGKYNIMLVGTRKDIAATKAWKGVVREKTKTEKLNYKNNL